MARPYVKLAKKKLRFKPKPKPEHGEWVRLKTLEEVCDLCGVAHWQDIYDPEIVEEMVEMFGTEVEVVDNGNSRNFRARGLRGNTWIFNTNWIDEKRYKSEILSDELFEI